MVLHSTRWLALSYFTYFFSYGIFLPFWSVWLAGNGLTPETIGILLGAGLVARFLGSLLIAPRVSDPSRLIAALRVLALLTLLFALAFWAGSHVAWLLAIIIGFNLFFSPLVPLTDALANTWQKQITMDYGRVRLWGSIAFVIGSALTGKLVSLFDYRAILLMLSLGVASMLLGMLLKPSVMPQGESRQQQGAGMAAWLTLVRQSWRFLA
ncbi:3-phenylpropionate MFS transporter, partial [Klebsiella pneumoniae]|nr:3-phenylpropionate MFS transporter [Klebsiella pneumoniae]